MCVDGLRLCHPLIGLRKCHPLRESLGQNCPRMSEEIRLTKKENARAAVLASAQCTGRTNEQIAQALGLSVRQVQRLKKALWEEGPAGLAHGNRGRSVAHALAEEVAKLIVDLYRTKYSGSGFSHFHEKLVEVEDIRICRSTVGRVLGEAGHGSPRKRRAAKHRSRRERRASEGAMLQIDGSPHDWLEGRGPRMCLVGAIDDATGKAPGAVFREHEDAQGYFLLMRGVVKRYGIPQTVYRDRHGIFERDPKEQESLLEQLEGRRPLTQFGRLMEELGIQQIAANSPQAKGRIERLRGTHRAPIASWRGGRTWTPCSVSNTSGAWPGITLSCSLAGLSRSGLGRAAGATPDAGSMSRSGSMAVFGSTTRTGVWLRHLRRRSRRCASGCAIPTADTPRNAPGQPQESPRLQGRARLPQLSASKRSRANPRRTTLGEGSG